MDGTRSERKIAETRLHERNCSTHSQKTARYPDSEKDSDSFGVGMLREFHAYILKQNMDHEAFVSVIVHLKSALLRITKTRGTHNG